MNFIKDGLFFFFFPSSLSLWLLCGATPMAKAAASTSLLLAQQFLKPSAALELVRVTDMIFPSSTSFAALLPGTASLPGRNAVISPVQLHQPCYPASTPPGSCRVCSLPFPGSDCMIVVFHLFLICACVFTPQMFYFTPSFSLQIIHTTGDGSSTVNQLLFSSVL